MIVYRQGLCNLSNTSSQVSLRSSSDSKFVEFWACRKPWKTALYNEGCDPLHLDFGSFQAHAYYVAAASGFAHS